MQQPALICARLHLVLLARELVDDRHAKLRASNPVTKFRGQVPLDLLARECTDSLKQWTDAKLRTGFGEEDRSRAYGVARVTFAHHHLVRALVIAGGDHRELFPHCPE